MILRGGIPDSGTAPAGGGRGLGADDVVASGRVPFVAIGKAASSNPWRRPAHRRCRVVAIRALSCPINVLLILPRVLLSV